MVAAKVSSQYQPIRPSTPPVTSTKRNVSGLGEKTKINSKPAMRKPSATCGQPAVAAHRNQRLMLQAPGTPTKKFTASGRPDA